MQIGKVLFLFFVFSASSVNVFAQKDTVKTDSTLFYKKIESFSAKGRFTKFLHQLIFKPIPIDSSNHKLKKIKRKKIIQKPYSSFEGKIIRNVTIVTFDPFGYSLTDTVVTRQSFLYRAANSLHNKSRQSTIRNLLLFRRNQKFDSLLVKESERLIRTRNYVHDVSFSIISSSPNSDSVDIFIRELDNWSIIPKIALSPSSITVDFTEKNFLGMGHEFQNDLTWFQATGRSRFNTNYHIPNINNTFINSTLHFSIDEYGNHSRFISADRPFFSPFAKWAAGIEFSHRFRKDIISGYGILPFSQNYASNSQDYWLGSAVQIFKGNSENSRTTNFVSTFRFLRVKYSQKPIDLFDPNHIYSDELLFLSSIGITTRKYIQDRYIFKYGVIEDVPIGRVFSLTGGYQTKTNGNRYYIGARISKGNFYPWGYLSSALEYGIFLKGSKAQQGVISGSFVYFTGLREFGTWKFRQFLKPQFTFGINRFSSDSLTLKDGFGLDGFNSTGLSGTNRMLLTLQTQSYAPWNVVGFRFGPFLSYSLGMLADAVTGFKNSRIYSQIGVGVLIKNENLVFSTLQLSISFYPLIPGLGQDIYKINSYKTTDFSFRDFEIGKPTTVVFQ